MFADLNVIKPTVPPPHALRVLSVAAPKYQKNKNLPHTPEETFHRCTEKQTTRKIYTGRKQVNGRNKTKKQGNTEYLSRKTFFHKPEFQDKNTSPYICYSIVLKPVKHRTGMIKPGGPEWTYKEINTSAPFYREDNAPNDPLSCSSKNITKN